MVKIKGQDKVILKSWQDFEKEIIDYALHGIPAKDKKGHSETIQFRVMPYMLDIISEVRQAMPEGWLRDSKTGKSMNHSTLYRIITIVGCKTILKIIEENTGQIFTDLDTKLKLLNKVRKAQRLNELKREAEDLQDDVIKSTLPNKSELVDKINDLCFSISEAIK